MHVLKFRVFFASVDVPPLQNKTTSLLDQMATTLLALDESSMLTRTPSAKG